MEIFYPSVRTGLDAKPNFHEISKKKNACSNLTMETVEIIEKHV